MPRVTTDIRLCMLLYGTGESSKLGELLLRHGADIEARTQPGRTPLHVAAQGGVPPQIATLLLKRGANVDAKDDEENTPLHLAASRRVEPNYGLEVMELLLEHGADENAKNKNGQTACQIAKEAHGDHRCGLPPT